jgi:hypothetical protein
MDTQEQFRSDWDVLVSFLPEGWREKAHSMGAMQRARKFKDEESLLRTLMIHLAEGCSMRETAVRAREGGLADVSDVAVIKRLRASDQWLCWMAERLFEKESFPTAKKKAGQFKIRMVDATTVSEPGSTGTDWRVHYSLELMPLRCDYFEVTDVHGGETFTRFPVRKGDLILGDRIYASAKGVAHVVEHGGHVIARMRINTLKLKTPDDKPFPLMRYLHRLKVGQVGEWPAVSHDGDGGKVEGRVCGVRRSAMSAKIAKKKLLENCSRQGHVPSGKRLESTKYVFVFTTLPSDVLSAADCLELYRTRWQIELAFKRLKSIMGLGHLPKYDPDSARAWIHGKLLVALWAETLVQAAHTISPWGYEISSERVPVLC